MNARIGLRATAVYHLIAGAVLFIVPTAPLRWVGLAPEVYQWSFHVLAFRLIGLFGLCVGAGAWLAADDPRRDSHLLQVLLLAKAGGAAALLYYAARGEFFVLLALTAVVHELIWIPVIGATLWGQSKKS